MVASGPKPKPKKRRTPAIEPVNAESVGAWLRQNPSFLAENPDLLFALTPPDHKRGDGVVDFQRFMVERQQRELDKLKEISQELLAVSRANKIVQQAVNRAVVALLAAPTFERAITTVTEDWAAILGADVVMIGMEAPSGQTTPGAKFGITLLAAGDVDSRLGRLQDAKVVSELDPPDPVVFGPAAGLAKSALWLRLKVHETVPAGMLAIGSRSRGHYKPRENMEQYRFLADVLSATVRAWLDLPEPSSVLKY